MTDEPGAISVDGRAVAFSQGQSVMQACEAAGIFIPHLCYDARVSVAGNCRLCMVKVNGRLMPACLTAAADGQQVVNRSEELTATRQDLLRMLFVEGNHSCPSCEKSGNCRLQALAYEEDVLDFDYPQRFPRRHLDASHPDVLLDRDRCIVCGLCVRASRELDGKGVFELGGRGLSTELLVNSPSGKLADSDLAAGDAAVLICPVGALLAKRKGFAVPIGQRAFDQRTIAGEPANRKWDSR